MIDAFPSPIHWYEIVEADELNSRLLSDIANLQKHSEGVNRSNRHGWQSKNDLFRRPETSFKQLCEIINACMMKTTSRHFSNLDLKDARISLNGWINVNFKGAYNAPHTHGSEFWSGTYYVSVPKTNFPDSGVIEFLDPRSRTQFMQIKGNNFLKPKVKFTPEPGKLVIFPSYLLHWVHPNEQEEERVSIAFNMRLGNPLVQE